MLMERKTLSDQQVESLRRITKTIPEFPAYSIDTNGHVYRLNHGKKTVLGAWKPHEVYGEITADGHKTYHLTKYLSTGPELRYVPVEYLLATAFIGPPPTPEHEAVYRDGNPYHSWSSNVTWRLRTHGAE